MEIKNIHKINLGKNEYLFHAGTTAYENNIYAIGGRVLSFVSLSNNYKSAKKKITKNINNLNWSGGFFRKDIGYKVID